MMTVEEAAMALEARLRGAPWVTAIGVGEFDHAPCIYLYSNAPKHHKLGFLRDGWQGYHVEVREMGVPRVAPPKS
jgi:hypothetical protein